MYLKYITDFPREKGNLDARNKEKIERPENK